MGCDSALTHHRRRQVLPQAEKGDADRWLLPEIAEVAMSHMRRPYPSDLSDAEWLLLEPLLVSSERRDRPAKWPMRRIADADLCLLRSGCAWRILRRAYPPWQTVYYHFRKWRPDGRLRQAHDRLRTAVREAEGKPRDPSGAILDS